MPNQFKSVVIAQLGEQPPPTRAERDVIYDRLRTELAAMADSEAHPGEHAEHRLALEQAIEAVETDLKDEEAPAAEAEAPAAAPASGKTPPPAGATTGRARNAALAAAALVVVAIVGAGAWYFVTAQGNVVRPPSSAVFPQRDANADLRKSLDPVATDKAKSFQDAMRSADAATAAFLLQSGYRPTRVELRTALLEVKFTRELQSATQTLAADIRDIACGFTTFAEVRRPMLTPRLFDAEDAFAIMKQLGQDSWKSICLADAGKWKAALAKIEQQNAEFNKPDAEKKQQADACIRRFGTSEAQERWAEANCDACPEGHSSCASYCPKAPKALDAEEARFFSFNRGDMQMAAATSRKTNASRAELYCNLQHLTRPTDFDLANLQRFKTLVGLLE